MTSPASASFPWPQMPEPPSGAFRSGRLPVKIGGSYLAARGSRPGPALLVLAGPPAGYSAVQGLLRLVDVLDAHRLAGSLLIRLASSAAQAMLDELLDPADALIVAGELRPGWRELEVVDHTGTGHQALNELAGRIAARSGARYRYARPAHAQPDGSVAVMAARGKIAVHWLIPDLFEERDQSVERVFQGMINMMREIGMLEGQVVEANGLEVQPPVTVPAPATGYWSPTARTGQRIRINDRLGSFRDGQGNELGDLVSNVSGILLGISINVWVDAGEPVAEMARPLT